MKYKSTLVLGLGLGLLSACSSAPKIESDQLISSEPYAQKVKQECIRLRVPEGQSNTLDEKTMEALCETRAEYFSLISKRYMSLNLNDGIVSCQSENPEQERMCLEKLQRDYYNTQSQKIIRRYQSKK